MDILAYTCFGLCCITLLISSIYVTVCAFRRHILWGLAYLFVPFAAFIYLIVDWRKVWKATLINIACVPLMILSMMLSPTFRAEMNKDRATTVNKADEDKSESDADSEPDSDSNSNSGSGSTTSRKPSK